MVRQAKVCQPVEGLKVRLVPLEMLHSNPAGLEAWMPRYQEAQRLELWVCLGSPASWLRAQGWLASCYLLMSCLRMSVSSFGGSGYFILVQSRGACDVAGGMPVFSHA